MELAATGRSSNDKLLASREDPHNRGSHPSAGPTARLRTTDGLAPPPVGYLGAFDCSTARAQEDGSLRSLQVLKV